MQHDFPKLRGSFVILPSLMGSCVTSYRTLLFQMQDLQVFPINENRQKLEIPLQSRNLAGPQEYSLGDQFWLYYMGLQRPSPYFRLALLVFLHCYSWLLEYQWNPYRQTTENFTKLTISNVFYWGWGPEYVSRIGGTWDNRITCCIPFQLSILYKKPS